MRYINFPVHLPSELAAWQTESQELLQKMEGAFIDESVLQNIAENKLPADKFPARWQETVKGNWPSSEQECQDKAREILASLSSDEKHVLGLASCSLVIKANEGHWKDGVLRDYLRSLSFNKCWYTEIFFGADYPQVEHFRPKNSVKNETKTVCHSGYWWLAFEFSNYRLAKPMPNIRKGIYFPLRRRALAACDPSMPLHYEIPMLLDPTNDDDVSMIAFNALGQPEPCHEPITDLTQWDRERIEFSIKVYGLDDPVICDRRKEIWVQITSMFNEVRVYKTKYDEDECLISKGKAEVLIEELMKFLEPEQEFTALIRDCFDAHPVGRSIRRRMMSVPVAA